jgi:peptidase E
LLVGTSIVGVSAGFGAAWGYQDGYNDAYIDSLTLTPMVGEHQGLILSGRF